MRSVREIDIDTVTSKTGARFEAANGAYLKVEPSGTKTWFKDVSFLEGRKVPVALGEYPAMREVRATQIASLKGSVQVIAIPRKKYEQRLSWLLESIAIVASEESEALALLERAIDRVGFFLANQHKEEDRQSVLDDVFRLATDVARLNAKFMSLTVAAGEWVSSLSQLSPAEIQKAEDSLIAEYSERIKSEARK